MADQTQHIAATARQVHVLKSNYLQVRARYQAHPNPDSSEAINLLRKYKSEKKLYKASKKIITLSTSISNGAIKQAEKDSNEDSRKHKAAINIQSVARGYLQRHGASAQYQLGEYRLRLELRKKRKKVFQRYSKKMENCISECWKLNF